MIDTKFYLGSDRQGHPTLNQKQPTMTEWDLAMRIQMGEEHVYKRSDNTVLNSELMWPDVLNLGVVLSVQPETYAVAQACIDYLVENAPMDVGEKIEKMANPLKPGKLFSSEPEIWY